MNIAQIVKCGEIAIEWHKAQNEKAEAKRAYHQAWRRFEVGADVDETIHYVDPEERVTKYDPQFDAACEATKVEYAAYRHAMDVARNVKRRLDNACRAALTKTQGGM